MRAGKNRNRITIEAPPTALTDAGELDQSGGWLLVANPWAEVRPLRGRELQLAREMFADVDVAVTMRYRAGILPTMRIRLRDDSLLDIVDARDLDFRKRQIDMLCRTTNVFGAAVGGVGTPTVGLKRDEFVADGLTDTFTLANTPRGEVAWFRNGMIQSPPDEYTRSGATIILPAISQANDVFTALYQV